MAFHPPPTPVFLDYCTLITSEHQKRFNFQFVVGWTANSIGQIVDNLIAARGLFDLDTALGEQLDFIGRWIGTSRRLQIPLDIFFSWDTLGRGWDEAEWRGGHEGDTQFVDLGDGDYRQLLKAMALANHWDGTLTNLQPILAIPFPSHVVHAVDGQDMTYDIWVTGPPMSPTKIAILTGPMARVRPAGVRIGAYHLP